jgi:hypothetical protein
LTKIPRNWPKDNLFEESIKYFKIPTGSQA